ncbi:MAG: histidine phosphatase family protein [Cyclobacteriaceae bacterium]
MPTLISQIVFILFFSIRTFGIFAQDGEITTFILVRHAEKVKSDDKNPPLTTKGSERANLLASMFEEVKIDAIYSTNYIRTINTAKPLSNATGVDMAFYEPRDYDELVATWLKNHNGQTVFVSGHSNTTPKVVNALLGVDEHADLTESEYDWVYIVDIIKVGVGKVKKLKVEIPR